MIGGEAIEGARAAMRQCTPGAVTLPAASMACAGNARETEPLGDGFGRLRARGANPIPVMRAGTAALPEAAWLRAHIPAAVLDRITAGHTGWMAEFRRVTVLFVQVPDAELRHPADLAAIQRTVTAIQTEIARCGGAIDDTGEDHGGLVVLAAFGLPGSTHDDDATRAVRAALNIAAALRTAIGVGTGRIFCGAIGSPSLRSYSMVGDAMNCGERLMRLAGDGVLCDDATRRAASRHLHFDFVRSEVLHGRQGAVAIHRPSERLRLPFPSAGMIGREDERHLLRQRIASLAGEGRGGVVIIEGEAGIGKSTLLAELRAAARAGGIRFFQGGADAIDAASTYHAWRPVFQQVLGITADSDAAARTATLLGALAAADRGGEARLAPLLNPIFGTNLPENEITIEMAAQSRAEAVTRMLVRLLGQSAAATPLVVAIEDCHWLDSASLALALALVRGVPGFLLALATRPLAADAPDTWIALRMAAGSDHLRLGPLSPEEVEVLAGRRLGAPQIDPALAQLVAERGGGNPFFSEEICHALRDGGLLRIENGRCRLAPEGADSAMLKLPDTVQGVVSARIDRLSARERLAMKVASVNGRIFSLQMLGAVHPVESDRPHLQDCVRRLVSLDFATPLGAADGDAFEFKHSIVQEVAYGQLTFSQRHELHRNLAEWLEREQPSNVALLARHWTEAAVPARAIHYLDRAGDEAVRRFANREAAGFLTRVIALAGSSGAEVDLLTRGRWHRQLGEAQFHLGRIAECRQDLAEAARLLGWPIPGGARLPALALPAAIVRQLARRVWPWRPRRCEPARREHLIEALHSYQLLGEAAYFTNDMATCGFCIFHGTNLAETLGPSPALARLYCGVMALAGMVSQRIGDAYLRLATRAVEACDNPHTTGYAGILMAIYLGGFGACERLHPPLGRACEIFRRYGDGRRLEESLVHFIYTRLHRGEYAACAQPIEEMRVSAESRDDTQSRGWVRILRSQLGLPTQGPGVALDVLGGDYETGVDALTCTAMHAAAAVARWRLGDADLARRHALIALERNERQPPVCYAMLLYTSYVAEVFLGLLASTPADSPQRRNDANLARRACRGMRRFARIFPVARARAALCDGLWHAAHGRLASAARCRRRALDAAVQFKLLPDQAAAHRCLSQSGGDAHLAEAAAIWERIGARAELDSLRASPHPVSARGLPPMIS